MSTRLLMLLLVPVLLPAQVHLTSRVGFAAHGAHAVDRGGADSPSFRPGTGGEVVLALGLDRGAWRVALGARRGPADLILRGSEAGVITPDAITATGLGLELGRRLAGGASGPTLHVLLGAERISWSFPGLDEPSRSGWNAVAALEGEVPLGRMVAGVVRVDGARGSSLFTADELPDGFVVTTASRVGLSVGIRVTR